MSQLINQNDLLEQFAGDRDLLKESADMLLEELSSYVKNVESAIAEGSAEKLETTAHTLKGAIGNFHAHSVTKMAADLEAIGRNGSTDGSSELLSELTKNLEALKQELNTIINTGGN